MSQPMQWGLGDHSDRIIVSYIRYIVRAAINSTPTTSPVKGGAKRESHLEAFNLPTEFDYGFRNLALSDDDSMDDDGEMVEMSDFDES
jgi:hypothetical protein